MNKQIEEMAKLACTCFDGNCKGCPFDFYPPCPPKASAQRLYNAGYRKQSEGEWICKWKSTFPQYEPDEYYCSNCGCIKNMMFAYCPCCGAKMKGGE